MNGTKWLKNQEHFDWMEKCLSCWRTCEQFMAWSIENEKYVTVLNTCRDVTEMCSQCLKFEAQRSPFFKQMCELSAEMSETLAGHLAALETNDPLISETINSCRIFSKASRQVSKKQVLETVKFKDNMVQQQQHKT
jgi:hypothetical protein